MEWSFIWYVLRLRLLGCAPSGCIVLLVILVVVVLSLLFIQQF
jgi:hypothetical protein